MPEAMARRFGETLAECQYEQWYDHTEDVCGHIESFRVKIVERTPVTISVVLAAHRHC